MDERIVSLHDPQARLAGNRLDGADTSEHTENPNIANPKSGTINKFFSLKKSVYDYRKGKIGPSEDSASTKIFERSLLRSMHPFISVPCKQK